MKKTIRLAALFFMIASSVSAADYYFEESYVPADTQKNCSYPLGIGADSKNEKAVYFWQETDPEKKEIYLNSKRSTDGLNWESTKKFAGPFRYMGDVPQLYSVAQSNETIVAAVFSEPGKIEIFSSTDYFENFHKTEIRTDESYIAPRVYRTRDNSFMLFVSQAKDDSFSICTSRSKDGISWSPFEKFSQTSEAANSFNPIAPILVPVKNGDLVIYQAQYTISNLISVQLYSTFSKDNGKTWTAPVMLTGQNIAEEGTKFDRFNNQFPSVISSSDGSICIAWERSPFSSTNSSIYYAQLGEDYSIKGSAEKISSTSYSCKPVLMEFNKTINLLWFTNSSAEKKVYLAQKIGAWWEDAKVLSRNNASYPCALTTKNGSELSFIWEEYNAKTKNTGLAVLNTDHSVSAPSITPVNYTSGKKTNRKTLQAKINIPFDSSGIKGYSWCLTKNPEEEPPLKLTNDTSETLIKQEIPEDGKWYLKAKTFDFAGNISASSESIFNLDTTAPASPLIADLAYDKNKFLKSNTFTINWTTGADEADVAGYTYSLKYVSTLPEHLIENSRHPLKIEKEKIDQTVKSLYSANNEELTEKQKLPEYIAGTKNKISYSNIKNGLYVFSVAAIDNVGNIGEQTSISFIANKYAPQTYITTIENKKGKFGDTSVQIYGGGFTYEGNIPELYIDRDGLEPYDYTLRLSAGEYKINSNNRISNILLTQIPKGSYKIGLLHSDRGLYFTKNSILKIEETGTVKLKNSFMYNPVIRFASETFTKKMNVTTIVLALVLILSAIGIVISSRSLSDTAKETFQVTREVKALIQGDIMPQEKKQKARVYKQKGISLKAKLVLHSSIMITLMDIAIFVAFGYYMITNQKKTMAQSLQERVSVMLNSISSGAKVYLPQTTTTDNLSLTDIANQVSALDESRYATITGFPADEGTAEMNSVWATTDSEILSKLDTEIFTPGVSRLTENGYEEILASYIALNQKAEEQSGDIAQNITELTKEGISLASKSDAKSIERRQEIQTIRNQLVVKLDGILSQISKDAEGSFPNFNADNIDTKNTEYTFYKPLLYRQSNDANYVHGMVFVKISTESLLARIEHERKIIITTCCIVLALAVILAIISTYVLASLIVRPIRKLADHVAMIRDTDDKEKLDGKDIVIKTKDEIGMLGDTVNEMTRGLVEAAVQSKNLTMGKDIQTRFIPLEVKDGITMTTGKLSAKGADFFSYYAGADELSGDYFDYKQLDEKHYAVIKCDVSGHGVPAALIMVEVATLFLNYFRNWNMKNPAQGLNISPIVGQINDLLESRGFKGRFAAFTLCIINTESGDCWFCNAGDNLVHVYDSVMKKKKIITLQETPAAGMFSTDLVDMKGGYQVSRFKLKKDDVLLLYTDGIEEAKRNFRDKDLQIIKCAESGIGEGEPHGTHAVGEDNEEMTPERVTKIIESVFERSKYELHKYHALDGQADFTFDFSTCEGSAEDAIMALVSVEKIFRMFKPKNAVQSDRIKVDRNIDTFLHQHFNQYAEYCSDKQDVEGDPTHIYWCGVREDPQYDDLTLVAIKKQ